MTLCSRNQVIPLDCVELIHCPPSHIDPRRNAKICPEIVADPIGQFGRQPAQNLMYCPVSIVDPLARRPVYGIAVNLIGTSNKINWCQWQSGANYF